MKPNAEVELIVYGATGYTRRLVAEHLAQRYGVGGEVEWAMGGRSQAKLEQVRDQVGAPKDTPDLGLRNRRKFVSPRPKKEEAHMNPNAEFDLIVYGATGYTGRLVAEHLAQRYGVGGEVKWAMAGRSQAKLEQVRDEIGAPKDTPLVVADAADPAQLEAMVKRAKAIITTVGPY